MQESDTFQKTNNLVMGLLEVEADVEESDAGVIALGVAMRDRTNAGELILEQLYDQYAHALFRYAVSLLNSAEDAEDAVQEVFVKIARGHRRVGRIRNLKAYLFTATRNASYTLLRSRKRGENLHEELCSDYLTRPAAGDELKSDAICKGFATLPIEQREVLVLHIYDGLTFKEIAKTIGSSISTVTSRYRYGIEKLRKTLDLRP